MRTRVLGRAWPCRTGGSSLLIMMLAMLIMLIMARASEATEVRVVAITPGKSADLVIDGVAPVTVEVGQSIEKVTLLRADRSSAVVSIDGISKTLPLVADPSVGHAASIATVTLPADPHGQFVTSGTVNGRPVTFLVDTGATFTTLFRADATRIGLDYRHGKPTVGSTVNGPVRGWKVSLDSVRVGDVIVRNVDAVVVDNDELSYGLLGMSFLGRFDMQRQGSTLVLRRNR